MMDLGTLRSRQLSRNHPLRGGESNGGGCPCKEVKASSKTDMEHTARRQHDRRSVEVQCRQRMLRDGSGGSHDRLVRPPHSLRRLALRSILAPRLASMRRSLTRARGLISQFASNRTWAIVIHSERGPTPLAALLHSCCLSRGEAPKRHQRAAYPFDTDWWYFLVSCSGTESDPVRCRRACQS